MPNNLKYSNILSVVCSFVERWNNDSNGYNQCIPLNYQSLININSLKFTDEPSLCEKPKDIIEYYIKYFEQGLNSCPKSCVTYTFKSKYHTSIGPVSDSKLIEIFYWFSSDDIQISQEYLIYNANGLIGSVGGALGLFIGFSFQELLNGFFYMLEHFITKSCGK